MEAVNVLAPDVGMSRACAALRVHRTGVYRDDARRRHLSILPAMRSPRPVPPLALSEAERQALKDVLCSERFADCAPPTIYATLLERAQATPANRSAPWAEQVQSQPPVICVAPRASRCQELCAGV